MKQPKQLLSLLPTPVQKLERISSEKGINLYCKRDDMTGIAFGGNKSRKLDYMLSFAISKGINTLIAVGGIQSNFCRLTAAYGSILGLNVHLVLGGKRPSKKTANLLLDYMFNANIHFVNSSDWSKWEVESLNLKNKLEKNGHIVFWMPIGGSNETGALGYVNAIKEIINDEKKLKIKFDYIFHASASGGTQAGLIAGKYIYNWNGDIIGIGVAKNKKFLSEDVFSLTKKLAAKKGIEIKRSAVIVDNNYMGAEYGSLTKDGIKNVNYFAKKEGIMLDYVYTGKAAAGMINYIKKGIIKKGSNVLFLHSGGNIHLFK